ncbi:uncharacterized protein LOC120512079 [Passer montanus]|uniref:uncharacterized protein LOC120512079 n=1 Tax=Passer montanus TaxID=9160 RepID=UPI001960D058|nr:uncharacterized protein LOC120512079 [Passer montanus]
MVLSKTSLATPQFHGFTENRDVCERGNGNYFWRCAVCRPSRAWVWVCGGLRGAPRAGPRCTAAAGRAVAPAERSARGTAAGSAAPAALRKPATGGGGRQTKSSPDRGAVKAKTRHFRVSHPSSPGVLARRPFITRWRAPALEHARCLSARCLRPPGGAHSPRRRRRAAHPVGCVYACMSMCVHVYVRARLKAQAHFVEFLPLSASAPRHFAGSSPSWAGAGAGAALLSAGGREEETVHKGASAEL